MGSALNDSCDNKHINKHYNPSLCGTSSKFILRYYYNINFSFCQTKNLKKYNGSFIHFFFNNKNNKNQF